MTTDVQSLFKRIKQLPPQRVAEVANFVDFLTEREAAQLHHVALNLQVNIQHAPLTSAEQDSDPVAARGIALLPRDLSSLAPSDKPPGRITPREFAIESFRALCDRVPGGVASIADAAGLSAESLTQVLKGTKLPSGKPRGLGPNSIDAITAQYPGWMDLGSGELTAGRAQAGPSLDQCLSVIARVVASSSKIQRKQLAALLEALATDPEDRADTCGAIMGILAKPPRLEGSSG